ncbi:carbohydrate ABC transporter permease [Radiobacillus sp. PE A8.2]|uniref:carbohydrate ABC transporter permease n=1 Tax=Radiobacillus sp. PE A8.2 TaxID=3380349 RepID=UPI00388E9512
MFTSKYTFKIGLVEFFTIILALIFLVPFYIVVINSFKDFSSILMNATAWPENFLFSNYIEAWHLINFPQALFNSTFVTTLSNIGLVIISSMAAWKLARSTGKFNNILFMLFVSAMVIPFQSVMIPLVMWGKEIGIMDSRLGLVMMYFGFGVSLNIFLYHGFVKSIPKEIEEAAIIDGCNSFQLFWRIVFPLLRSITVTVIILNSLWIWNDFMLPMIAVTSDELLTIPLAINKLFGQFMNQWDKALPAMVMSIVPIISLYFFLQRHILRGIAAGAIKS